MSFFDKLNASWRSSGSMLCVGLDPDLELMPPHLGARGDAIERFCCDIIDATASVACAFKPQFAHFASVAAEPQLEHVCAYIREAYPGHVLLLDAKRGDIGSTAEHYAREMFVRYGADATTVNPYLGSDAVEPFLRHEGKGTFILCRTSNPGGDDFQSLRVDGEPLYTRVARKVAEDWSRIGECGLVVGATYPAEAGVVRDIAGDLPFLVPGVGTQGGDVEATVKAGQNSAGFGLLMSSSRAVMYASSGEDYAEAAHRVAQATRDEIRLVSAG